MNKFGNQDKNNLATIFIVVLLLASSGSNSFAQSKCAPLIDRAVRPARYVKIRPETQEITFDMPGMKVGSVSDTTLATGATLFLFDKGATANYDARGGSVAAAETNLLDESSYSNEIDGILFSGGSTMGLEAGQGVRRRIFQERSQDAGDFDFIPSVPGAVVYDYGNRPEPGQNQLRYPDLIMGAATYDSAKENRMLIGRAGAGTSTTANKVSSPIWGGQGGAFKEVRLKDGFTFKIFAAVVLNSHGNIYLPDGSVLNRQKLKTLSPQVVTKGHKKNTTLSIVVTDVSLNRSQLKRLAVMVHTSMASSIRPFHTYTDGDILFTVSLNKKEMPAEGAYDREDILQTLAAETMTEAILKSAVTANSPSQTAGKK